MPGAPKSAKQSGSPQMPRSAALSVASGLSGEPIRSAAEIAWKNWKRGRQPKADNPKAAMLAPK